MMIAKDYIVPVSRGEIRWHPEPWGAVITERIYVQFGYVDQAIRMPWSVLEQITETAP